MVVIIAVAVLVVKGKIEGTGKAGNLTRKNDPIFTIEAAIDTKKTEIAEVPKGPDVTIPTTTAMKRVVLGESIPVEGMIAKTKKAIKGEERKAGMGNTGKKRKVSKTIEYPEVVTSQKGRVDTMEGERKNLSAATLALQFIPLQYKD